MIRVLIVDDHELVAEGFARLIERSFNYKIVGILRSAEALYEALSTGLDPEVCVLDLTLPGASGAEVLRTLRREYPAVRILVVSASARPEIATLCIREGALGFLSKFQCGSELLRALETVANGEHYVDKDLFDKVLSYMLSAQSSDRQMDDLSTRELTVMKKIAKGMSIKEIAAVLNLNAKTVSTYRARLLKKLNIKSNAELTAYCLQHGVIQFEIAP